MRLSDLRRTAAEMLDTYNPACAAPARHTDTAIRERLVSAVEVGMTRRSAAKRFGVAAPVETL